MTISGGVLLRVAWVDSHEIPTMPDIVFNEEWVVESRLTEKTGLSESQIKSYRHHSWIEGIHFKHVTAKGDTMSAKGTLWYNHPKINSFITEA